VPRLQRAARHVQHRGRLTLGAALDLQIALPHQQIGSFEAIPALMALIMATLRGMDDCSHSSLLLLLKPL
jgi:hypothetical protein